MIAPSLAILAVIGEFKMLKITATLKLDLSEVHFTFIRAPGPGGQNVNKVASAVLLRFNVTHSPSLPEPVRIRLAAIAGSKMTQQGDLLIKATSYRTQERNKQNALQRLQALIKHAATPPKKRKKTKVSFAAKQRRLDTKKLHGKTKSLRQHKPNKDE
jgi:ribosome-associated protein